MSPSWAAPRLGRVIGAAHRRQGRPCQDAVLALQAVDPTGESLQLMAVADGHGGARYWLSEVGSQLACEQAAAAIREELTTRPLCDDGWQQWLSEHLPLAVHQRWLAAIEADWQHRADVDGEMFSPLTYGTTLGLVVLCRHWWAAGGLGDWDLLAVDGGGEIAVLNQEPDLGGGGEATASLCQPEAPMLWRQRCQLEPLTLERPPFTLLLSSDGLRKSCATDGDYRILGAYLCGLPADQGGEGASAPGPGASDPGDPDRGDPTSLEEALARITAEGSGDDVSVAIARWGPWAGERREDAGGVAPAPTGGWGRAQHPRLGRPQLLGGLLVGGLAFAVAALLVHTRSHESRGAGDAPASRPPLGDADRAALATKITALCHADPMTRRATLRTRRSQFKRLADGTLLSAAVLAEASEDPLGALIAASQPPAVPPAGWPPLCPELQEDLRSAWQGVPPLQPPVGRQRHLPPPQPPAP